MDKTKNQIIKEKIIYCFDILSEKYKIDIEEVIDFKNLISDLDEEKLCSLNGQVYKNLSGRYKMKTEIANKTVTEFRAEYNHELPARTIGFELSDDGLVLWGGYYLDTLMQSAVGWLEGHNLCTDGGSNTCITNMGDFVRHVLENRYEIEQELREGK